MEFILIDHNAKNYTARLWMPRVKERKRENLPYGGVVFDVYKSCAGIKYVRNFAYPFSFKIGENFILFFIYCPSGNGYFVEAEQSIDYYSCQKN